MKPSVGRIVHYTNLGDRDGKYPPELQAAIITKVVDEHGPNTAHPTSDSQPYVQPAIDDEARYRVSLRVLYEDGDFTMRGVAFTTAAPGSEGARGRWAWPLRE